MAEAAECDGGDGVKCDIPNVTLGKTAYFLCFRQMRKNAHLILAQQTGGQMGMEWIMSETTAHSVRADQVVRIDVIPDGPGAKRYFVQVRCLDGSSFCHAREKEWRDALSAAAQLRIQLMLSVPRAKLTDEQIDAVFKLKTKELDRDDLLRAAKEAMEREGVTVLPDEPVRNCWTGAAGNGDFADKRNWSAAKVPTTGDEVYAPIPDTLRRVQEKPKTGQHCELCTEPATLATLPPPGEKIRHVWCVDHAPKTGVGQIVGWLDSGDVPKLQVWKNTLIHPKFFEEATPGYADSPSFEVQG